MKAVIARAVPEPSVRMKQAHNDMAVITARVQELTSLITEPVASVSEAIRSFTPEQREALWASRTEAMEIVAQQRMEVEDQLGRLTARRRELHEEFTEVQTARDFKRLAELAEWSSAHEDEASQLKTLLRELDALYGELEANPVAPT